MLTEEQRQELKKKIMQLGRTGGVTEKDLDEFPASREEMILPTSVGGTKVIKFEYGEKSWNRPIILNFHGGGFIGGRNNRDELYCRRMAVSFQALVIDVDYKLAPEFPYPIAVNESWEVMKWIWENRSSLVYDLEKIVLTGHSAGGNLVAGICMRAGLEKDFHLCCAVVDYSPLDLVTDPGNKKRTSCDMPAEMARDYNNKYILPQRAMEPYASPLYAPDELLAEFPDTLIISAGEDSLCDEDEKFALRLIQAGVCVTAKRFTQSMHGFIINRMCEWQDGINLIINFIRQHI